MSGVSGLCIRETSLKPRERTVSTAVFGRPSSPPARLAKLPALVALNPPADAPLIMLWLVLSVLVVRLVLTLCTPLEEFVVLDLVV